MDRMPLLIPRAMYRCLDVDHIPLERAVLHVDRADVDVLWRVVRTDGNRVHAHAKVLHRSDRIGQIFGRRVAPIRKHHHARHALALQIFHHRAHARYHLRAVADRF